MERILREFYSLYANRIRRRINIRRKIDMIDTMTYAAQIERGLNAILATLGEEDAEIREGYSFSVVPDFRQFKRAEKIENKNSVITYINCLLTSTPSANATTSDGLELLVDNFSLYIAVPTLMARVNAQSNPAYKDEQTGVYVFVEKIKNIVNDYLKVNKVESFTDLHTGKTYACGYVYTLSRTGESGDSPIIGEYVPFEAYIAINIVQNGINSKDITLELDGESVSFQTLYPGRKSVQSGAVFSDGTGASRAFATSTALSFDVSLPATTGTVTEQFNDFLTGGEMNIAHFVRFQFGADSETYYLMTFGDIGTSVQGVTNAGLTLPLVEAVHKPSMLHFPEYMKQQRIAVGVGDGIKFSLYGVTAAGGAILLLGNTIIRVDQDGAVSHTFSEDELEYEEDDGLYYATIVACPVDKTKSISVYVEAVIKAGLYGYPKLSNLETDKYYAETFDFYLGSGQKFEHFVVTKKTDDSGLVNTITYIGSDTELVIYENDSVLDHDYIDLKEDAAVSIDFYNNFFKKAFIKI